MRTDPLTRRRFLAAAIALSSAGSTLGASLFAVSRAWASDPAAAGLEAHADWLRLARLLYPHDALSDAAYAAAFGAALAGAESDSALTEVGAALDAQARGSWFELDPAGQLAAMQAVQNLAAFVAVQNQVRASIYNGAEFWRHVGYPGPSKDFGGYRHRGAGDIDWLPDES
jgi:hypothetical protein